MNPHHKTVRWLRGVKGQVKAALWATFLTGAYMGYLNMLKRVSTAQVDTIGEACASFSLTMILALVVVRKVLKIYDAKSPWG